MDNIKINAIAKDKLLNLKPNYQVTNQESKKNIFDTNNGIENIELDVKPSKNIKESYYTIGKFRSIGTSGVDHKGNPTTLPQISRETGLSIEEIIKMNPDIKDPNYIEEGQKIKIITEENVSNEEVSNQGPSLEKYEKWKNEQQKNISEHEVNTTSEPSKTNEASKEISDLKVTKRDEFKEQQLNKMDNYQEPTKTNEASKEIPDLTVTKRDEFKEQQLNKMDNYQEPTKNIESMFDPIVNRQIDSVQEKYENISNNQQQYGNINYANEINNNGYRAQGVTTINEDYVIISAYDKDGKDGKRERQNSKLFVYDKTSGEFITAINLDNVYAHVGGVSLDKKDNLLLITGKSGNLMAVDCDQEKLSFLSKSMKEHGYTIDLSAKEINVSAFEVNCDIKVDDITSIGEASTIYYDDNSLYIATCDQDGSGRGQVVRYDGVCKDGNTIKHSEPVVYDFNVPDYTQGVCATSYNGKDYLITTQSYSGSQSTITVQDLSNGGKKVGSVYLNQAGAESLSMDENGKIICCFEFGKKEIFETNINELMSMVNEANKKGKNISFVYEKDKEKQLGKDFSQDGPIKMTIDKL